MIDERAAVQEPFHGKGYMRLDENGQIPADEEAWAREMTRGQEG
ncbi:MAG: hypothetical protein ACYCW6_21495 [Candidatus Xenobia bacterium]